jgi:hypothetical protein
MGDVGSGRPAQAEGSSPRSAGAVPGGLPSFEGVRMRAVETAGTGQVDGDTLFIFSQHGNTVSARYAGGTVELGYLVGSLATGVLVFRYCQIDRQGAVHGGRSVCDVTRLSDGRIRLREHFHWESREGQGTNVLEQVDG